MVNPVHIRKHIVIVFALNPLGLISTLPSIVRSKSRCCVRGERRISHERRVMSERSQKQQQYWRLGRLET